MPENKIPSWGFYVIDDDFEITGTIAEGWSGGGVKAKVTEALLDGFKNGSVSSTDCVLLVIGDDVIYGGRVSGLLKGIGDKEF